MFKRLKIIKCTKISLERKDRNLGPDDLILDVRTPEEFQAGHIHGAQNTPHDEVVSIADTLKRYKIIYMRDFNV